MRLLDSIGQDARYAVRAMRSSAGLTAVAVLSLALGIGATIAIFSVMYALAFRALPVAHPERLVGLAGQLEGLNGYSYAEWKLFREKQNIFSSVAAFHNPFSIAGGFSITASSRRKQVSGVYVSGGYFRTLGIPAIVGRVLQPSDDKTGAPPVCVLGYGLWRGLYGQSKNGLGQTILVDGHEFQIVGVAPRSFSGVVTGEISEIFMPLEAERTYKDYPLLYGRQTPSLDSNATIVSIIARLKPGMN